MNITLTLDPSDIAQAVGKIAARQASVQHKVVVAVQTSAINIEREIKETLQRGGRTGHIYRRVSKSGNVVEHQASAPGEPPKTDLGGLALSYQRRSSLSGLGAEVYSDSEYALALEFGRLDGSIKPRPHANPAAEKERPHYVQRVKEALR